MKSYAVVFGLPSSEVESRIKAAIETSLARHGLSCGSVSLIGEANSSLIEIRLDGLGTFKVATEDAVTGRLESSIDDSIRVLAPKKG